MPSSTPRYNGPNDQTKKQPLACLTTNILHHSLPENSMKTLFFIASLTITLLAAPAIAQLGPAGVPGAPGLAETDPSVMPAKPAPATLPPAQTQAQPATSTDCSKAKNVAQCKKRQQARKKAQNEDCSKAAEPARCEQHKKARVLCKDKAVADYRQCLRDNLAPKK